MKVLSQLLGQFPLERFLGEHFTRLPFSSAGGAGAFTKLLDWSVVEEIIAANKSVLRIVQDGRVIRDYVELKFSEARDHHAQGHTLLLRYAEKSHLALAELARDFAHSFHTPVDIQLYCTPGGHNAFGWHYDVEEVFIIQTQGSKQYTIRPNTVHPNPLISSIPKNQGYEQETTDLAINVTLAAGDWLYIPSGWWHVAKTQAESMHISIGLMPSSAVDIAQYLPQFLATQTFWRTRMPVHQKFERPEDEVAFYQDALRKLGQNLVDQMSSAEFIRSFLQHKQSYRQ
jgi:50S ribosomal protein L16 3-hydroxylase